MSVAKDTEIGKGYVVNRGYQVLFAPIGMPIEMVRGWVEALTLIVSTYLALTIESGAGQ
ncbi:hypothetical protein [Coleofasciculus sp. G2-EDA-02]|uniref:hypothetical protein n=1 Tax=Coleofasciculus sp. G2-EDA-02 TaxID=3069529 RepID=UPI0033017006